MNLRLARQQQLGKYRVNLVQSNLSSSDWTATLCISIPTFKLYRYIFENLKRLDWSILVGGALYQYIFEDNYMSEV